MSTHLITPTALVRDGQLVQGESVLIEDGRIIGRIVVVPDGV